MNEKAMREWLTKHRPAIACALDYCITHDEERLLLNHHAGIEIRPEDDTEEACRRYLAAFERQECSKS